MRNWTKTAGLLFLAASAVYFDPVNVAGTARPANSKAKANATVAVMAPKSSPTEVKLLETAEAAEVTADPFANSVPTDASSELASTPATQPAGAVPAAAEGTSVTDSEVKVSDAGTVEIHVNDASLVEVLRMLSLQSQKN